MGSPGNLWKESEKPATARKAMSDGARALGIDMSPEFLDRCGDIVEKHSGFSCEALVLIVQELLNELEDDGLY